MREVKEIQHFVGPSISKKSIGTNGKGTAQIAVEMHVDGYPGRFYIEYRP